MFVYDARELRVVCVMVVNEEQGNRYDAKFYLPDGLLLWEMEDVPTLLADMLVRASVSFRDE